MVSLQIFVSRQCVDECACIRMHFDLYVWYQVEVQAFVLELLIFLC